jgi:hypothetical protein
MGELKAANQNIPILTKEGLRLTSIGYALYVSVPVSEHAMPWGEPSLTTRTPSACHLLVRRPQLRGLPHHRGQVPTRNTMARCDGATVEWPSSLTEETGAPAVAQMWPAVVLCNGKNAKCSDPRPPNVR